MENSAIYHQPCSSYAYAYDNETLHLKIRTRADDVRSVSIIWGDPFENNQIEEGVYLWVSRKEEMSKLAQTKLHDYWFISIKPPFRRSQYGFILTGNDGSKIFYGDRGVLTINKETLTTPDNFFKFPFIHEIDRFKAPEWVKSTVWYQIFPERFANGDPSISPKNALPWGSKVPDRNDFFGGDLQGIIDHLDYLHDLGVGGIYLNPIFEAPSNHKYDTLDYFAIDPHFGTKETFKKLIHEAHQRGIRIMLDAVFNHIGSTSKQWLDVVQKEDKSRYKDWFHIHSFPVKEGENGNFEGKTTLSFDTFAFTPKMPKLNTANPEVQKYLLDISTYWIREFDIDGWRLDVANEVDHMFWKYFHKAVTAVKSDIYIVGEIWHDAWNWLQGDEFHSVMNYPLTQSILNFFVEDKITATEAISAINEHFMKYPQTVNEVTFNLLDSHDTARILTKAGGDKQKVKQALAFLFAQTGSPCIYYGTEIGLDGGNDPLCRKCMIWDEEKQDRDMLEFSKKLIKLRKDYQSILSNSKLRWIQNNNLPKNVLCFSRELGNQSLIFIFNHEEKACSISLEGNTSYVDVWNGGGAVTKKITVQAQQFTVLKTDG